jgi:hypothetical protein
MLYTHFLGLCGLHFHEDTVLTEISCDFSIYFPACFSASLLWFVWNPQWSWRGAMDIHPVTDVKYDLIWKEPCFQKYHAKLYVLTYIHVEVEHRTECACCSVLTGISRYPMNCNPHVRRVSHNTCSTHMLYHLMCSHNVRVDHPVPITAPRAGTHTWLRRTSSIFAVLEGVTPHPSTAHGCQGSLLEGNL